MANHRYIAKYLGVGCYRLVRVLRPGTMWVFNRPLSSGFGELVLCNIVLVFIRHKSRYLFIEADFRQKKRPVMGRFLFRKITILTHSRMGLFFLQTVVHIVFNRMRTHTNTGNFFHFQCDVAINCVISENTAACQEFTVIVQSV